MQKICAIHIKPGKEWLSIQEKILLGVVSWKHSKLISLLVIVNFQKLKHKTAIQNQTRMDDNATVQMLFRLTLANQPYLIYSHFSIESSCILHLPSLQRNFCSFHIILPVDSVLNDLRNQSCPKLSPAKDVVSCFFMYLDW